MRIEPMENRPGYYTLSDETNHFPVPLSALDLLILTDQLARLRPVLEQETRTLMKNSQRKIDEETFQRLLAETDTPGRDRFFDADPLASERHIFPWSTYPHIRIDRHR